MLSTSKYQLLTLSSNYETSGYDKKRTLTNLKAIEWMYKYRCIMQRMNIVMVILILWNWAKIFCIMPSLFYYIFSSLVEVRFHHTKMPISFIDSRYSFNAILMYNSNDYILVAKNFLKGKWCHFMRKNPFASNS